MAVAEALAEVLAFPDVAFDPAAAAEAMDVAVQQQQRPPDEAAQQSPAPASASSSTSVGDERAPIVNTTAPRRPVRVDELDMGGSVEWLVRSIDREAAASQGSAASSAKRGKTPRGARSGRPPG